MVSKVIIILGHESAGTKELADVMFDEIIEHGYLKEEALHLKEIENIIINGSEDKIAIITSSSLPKRMLEEWKIMHPKIDIKIFQLT